MKRMLPMILMLAMLLTACGAPTQGGKTEENGSLGAPMEEEVTAPETGLSLKIEHEVYDPSVEHFTYFITNTTEEVVEFGEEYAIQRWEDGAWRDLEMKSNAGWNAIGYGLRPGGTFALTFGFGLYKERPKAGDYRLVKEVGDETLYAAFELGESSYTAETPYGFGPLEDLPSDYGAATAADADVVFTGEGVKNGMAVEGFLRKVGLGVDCQLRTVQDHGEGAVMVIDVIYENDHFLWRMRSNGYVTEKRFSYIVTDGTALYLSNGADWENTLAYDSDKAFLVPEGSLEQLVLPVEQMTEDRLEGNSTRYKLWSENNGNGMWSAGLPEGEPTGFLISWHSNGGGWGSSYDLRDWDGLETAIRNMEWQDDGTLRLTCDTLDGGTSRLTFDPVSESFQ